MRPNAKHISELVISGRNCFYPRRTGNGEQSVKLQSEMGCEEKQGAKSPASHERLTNCQIIMHSSVCSAVRLK